MNHVLQQLLDGKDLSQSQTEDFFSKVVQGEIEPALLASVLTALKIKGETPDEIAGAAVAIRNAAKAFPATDEMLVDCVGTGGDGHSTINISTTAAIVAGACGLKVAKHGNRSVSSKSGSADLLEAFGVNLMMSPQTAAKSIAQSGACFLFAPNYHLGFKHAAPVRAAMGVRTLFNILGPLVNPAAPKVMLLGVYTTELLMPIAKALQLTGVQRAWVVHGSGLDEVAIHGSSQIIEIDGDRLIEKTVKPEDFGLATHVLESIKGGTPEQNAAYSLAILQGGGEPAHIDAVTINTAALLYLAGKAKNLIDATKQVQLVLKSGQAAETLKAMVAISNGVESSND
ncbi:anthranilate phosphoribosyltransferase [Thalassotalea sp. ND16A]|uniref:anthranilate phosphoribosyltransferase n=1 Tax=Thalassotalea sp. ND16A TaxID=1535422 RepID=UPI000519F4E4|nr:anthranilate phosphoribosyltransferase [Thalassotalea sp. ND16A]KGK00921.1 Anthranilate phosphoribosyltransferase [Thalassotalea sp. ND16A]